MKLEVIKTAELDAAQSALADAYEDIILQLERQPEFAGAPNVTVQVVLEGSDGCAHWNVKESALGFHAVSRGGGADLQELHLNLDAGLRALSNAPDADEKERAVDLAAVLVTAPHALLHVFDWLRDNPEFKLAKAFGNDGRQFEFDGGGGEPSEDKNEVIALEIVRRFMPGFISAHARKISETMAVAPALATP